MNNKVGKWYVKIKNGSDDEWEDLFFHKKYWFADPMLFKYRNNTYLFTEAFDTILQKGKLAVSKLVDGKFTKPKIILNKSYHLSYPCVFQYQDKLYMIPETSQSHRLELYVGNETVDKWKRKLVLLKNVKYDDPTVVQVGEKYFIFCYEQKNNHFSTFIYQLKPEQNWSIELIQKIDHAENKYRPGGRFFTINEDWYRPLQNNIKTYGESLRICKVLYWEPYSEVEVDTITADKLISEHKFSTDIERVHTYGTLDEMEIYDCYITKEKFWEKRREIFRKIREVFFRLKNHEKIPWKKILKKNKRN